MKSPLTHAPLSGTRLALAAAVALIVGLAFLPPLVAPGVRGAVMTVLAPLCHQLPERSFALAGVHLGLCHRCLALLGALALSLAVPAATARFAAPAAVLAIAFLPLALDWGLDAAGLWSNTTATRFATGAWAGAVLGLLIGAAAPRRVRNVQAR